MNQTVYVTTSEQGFVSDFKLTSADGYQAITVPLAWIPDFMKYPTKFSIIDGVLKAPGNLPTISTDELKTQLDSAKQTINDQQAIITQLKALSGQLVGQQVELNNTIGQLKTIAGQLTGQVATLTQGGN